LTERQALAPFLAGVRGRCPNCGGGPLFEGFLRIRPLCQACGFDLGASDSGDGPAVFVIIIVGFIAVFGAMFTMIAYPEAPIWAPLAIWIPVAGGLSLALLRPMKGLMVAAHVRNRAGSA
jgi:uncharacterized protein (DUF983 family)